MSDSYISSEASSMISNISTTFTYLSLKQDMLQKTSLPKSNTTVIPEPEERRDRIQRRWSSLNQADTPCHVRNVLDRTADDFARMFNMRRRSSV